MPCKNKALLKVNYSLSAGKALGGGAYLDESFISSFESEIQVDKLLFQ
jgi:hypothetical protein